MYLNNYYATIPVNAVVVPFAFPPPRDSTDQPLPDHINMQFSPIVVKVIFAHSPSVLSGVHFQEFAVDTA